MTIALLAAGVLLLALGAVLGAAELRWRSRTADLVNRLRHGGVAPRAVYHPSALTALPPPVARYFRTALRDGQPIVRYARLTQRGSFLTRPPDRFTPFTAVHHISTDPDGFVWDARMPMAPGVAVRVRDAFLDGHGTMRVTVLGLWPVLTAADSPELAAGALQRYLAEAAWAPTSLLPRPGLTWSDIDAQRARATLAAGGTTISLDFHFGEDGLIERVFSQARGREVDGRSVPTPWQGRWLRYEMRDGMQIPVAGEVAWLIDASWQPYWRGEIVESRFEY